MHAHLRGNALRIDRLVSRTVDRRFDRTRHDATRTVEALAVSLRGDLTAADLHTELLSTVQRVAPSTASVWLATADRST